MESNKYAKEMTMAKGMKAPVYGAEIDEACQDDPGKRKLFKALGDAYARDAEMAVEMDRDGVITVNFDGSGYDNGYYLRQEFASQAEGLNAFLKKWNSENGTDYDFEPVEDEWYFQVTEPEDAAAERSEIDGISHMLDGSFGGEYRERQDLVTKFENIIRSQFPKAGD